MISEIFGSLIIASMKIIRNNAFAHSDVATKQTDFSIPIFVPTIFVIGEIKKSIKMMKIIIEVIFGQPIKTDSDSEFESLDEVIEALVDPSLGGLDEEDDSKITEEELKTSKNFQLLMGTMKNNNRRRKFWKMKLKHLFKYANREWILSQFSLCKKFLTDNSFEVDRSKLPDFYQSSNDYLDGIVYSNYLVKRKPIARGDSGLDSKAGYANSDQGEIESGKEDKVHIINLTSMIGFIVGYEKKVRRECKIDYHKDHKNSISLDKIKELHKENQKKMKRFFSSNFSVCMKAFQSSKDS